MFVDLDVVEFSDVDVPFISIILNTALIRQVQPIDTHIQSSFLEGREQAIEDQKDDPKIKVSPVKELPSKGAIIYMVSPQLGTYYTVTPYEEVKAKLLAIGKGSVTEAE